MTPDPFTPAPFVAIRLTGLFAISGYSGKASGGFLEVFDLFSEQFSVNFPDEMSGKNRRKSLYKPFKSLLKALKRPSKRLFRGL